jgi:hypothetical protein
MSALAESIFQKQKPRDNLVQIYLDIHIDCLQYVDRFLIDSNAYNAQRFIPSLLADLGIACQAVGKEVHDSIERQRVQQQMKETLF